jgi:hypothetical protein
MEIQHNNQCNGANYVIDAREEPSTFQGVYTTKLRMINNPLISFTLLELSNRNIGSIFKHFRNGDVVSFSPYTDIHNQLNDQDDTFYIHDKIILNSEMGSNVNKVVLDSNSIIPINRFWFMMKYYRLSDPHLE